MARIDPDQKLTGDQERTLNQAAMLILRAHDEAKRMLEKARVVLLPDDSSTDGGHCTAIIPAFGQCRCSHYEGDGGPCEHHISVDGGVYPPQDMCGHAPWKHVPSYYP